jgi:hypothetical protein
MPFIKSIVFFVCFIYSAFEQHHAAIISVLWELVVNSNADLKISAATIMKILVGACVFEAILYFCAKH